MILLFILFAAGIAGSILFFSWKYGISPTPTSPRVSQKLLELLPHLPSGKIAEFGSGWGTLAFALARQFPQCEIIAIEISPVPYFCSWLVSKWCNYPNLHLQWRDFFDYPLHSTTMVICYLYPGAMEKLKSKFEAELGPEAYVASHTFAIPGWKPLTLAHADDLYRTPMYIYQVKRSTS